jgi:protein-tyrosine phosphatase
MVFSDRINEGLAARLPEGVRQLLCPDGALSLYVPGHEALTEALYVLSAPLVLATPGPHAALSTVEGMREVAGDAVQFILDDGPCTCTKAFTVVRINGPGWSMLTEGAVTAAEIARKTVCMIVFVCTGNTCRSPMAEALCRKLLADRLHCTPSELPERGFLILSAGIAALPGDPASPEAVEVMTELGAELKDHTSRPLSSDMVWQADYLITMTRAHQVAMASRFAPYMAETRLLDPAGGDVADPVGAEREVYRDCARQIREHLEKFVAELPIPAQTSV